MEKDLLDYQKFIKSNEACLLYFFTNKCAPCAELRPKVQLLLENKYPKIKSAFIAADEFGEVSACYNVFVSPTIILFFEGKETRRFSKFVSIDDIDQAINRYYSLLFD